MLALPVAKTAAGPVDAAVLLLIPHQGGVSAASSPQNSSSMQHLMQCNALVVDHISHVLITWCKAPACGSPLPAP
jgi:hypothetical protein